MRNSVCLLWRQAARLSDIFSETLAATGQAHGSVQFPEIRHRIVQLLLINLPDMHVPYTQLGLLLKGVLFKLLLIIKWMASHSLPENQTVFYAARLKGWLHCTTAQLCAFVFNATFLKIIPVLWLLATSKPSVQLLLPPQQPHPKLATKNILIPSQMDSTTNPSVIK